MDERLGQLADQMLEALQGFMDGFNLSLENATRPVVDRMLHDKQQVVDDLTAKFTFTDWRPGRSW